MDEKAFTDPVSILRKIEESCRVCCATEPQQSAEIFSQWSCIAFRVGDNSLSVSLDEVVEILDMPKLTRVPLAQTWVCGIANIRGNLLPVVDFSGFLNGEVTCTGEKTRVLVIDYNGVYSGLVVDEVYGLKHFMENEYTDVKPEIDEFLLPYIRNGFYREGKMWHEISLFALAESPRFMMAAV
jgi:twitching motility protein PilI